jgi:hypothetical protein
MPNLEDLKDLLETLVNEYSIRNEYGMSYDDYYHQYEEEENIPFKAQNILDDLDGIFKVESRKRKLKKIK